MDPHLTTGGSSKGQHSQPPVIPNPSATQPIQSLMDMDVVPPAQKRPLSPGKIQDPHGWNIALSNPKKGRKAPIKPKSAPTTVSNSFAPLAASSTTQETQSIPPKPKRPPPIVLDPSVYSTSKLAQCVRSLGISQFRVHNSPKGLHLYIDAQDDYSKATEKLKATHGTENPVHFHTYAPRGSKPNQKFLLIGLDEDHPIDSIKQALQHPDLVDVRRLTTYRDGVQSDTPNVLVTFKPTYSYTSHLKSIRAIDNIIIRHKPFNTSRGLPTCGNCQEIGHTKRYCWRPKRCAKCGKDHSTSECQSNTPLECPNCRGAHHASYRLCPRRVALMQRSQAGKSRSQHPVPRHPPPPPPSVWNTPLPSSNAPTAAQHLFPQAYPPPQTTPQVPLLPNPTPQSQDSAPRWVAELTTTLTSMLNMLMNTVQALMTALPSMLHK